MTGRVPPLFFLITGAVIIIDQLSKAWAVSQDFGVRLNQGVAFGWGDQWVELLWLITMGMIVLLWYGFNKVWKKWPVAAGFFFGGAITNLIDRMLYNGVRDWMWMPVMNLYNNLGDWAISVGVILILAGMYQDHIKGKKV